MRFIIDFILLFWATFFVSMGFLSNPNNFALMAYQISSLALVIGWIEAIKIIRDIQKGRGQYAKIT